MMTLDQLLATNRANMQKVIELVQERQITTQEREKFLKICILEKTNPIKAIGATESFMQGFVMTYNRLLADHAFGIQKDIANLSYEDFNRYYFATIQTEIEFWLELGTAIRVRILGE